MSKPRPADNSELHLGFFFPSGKTNFLFSDEAARRTPEQTKRNLVDLVQAAERVGFDSVFIPDGWSGHQRVAEQFGHQAPAFHAGLLAMALLTATDHIGVISTFHTTYHQPAHIARMAATLDSFSDGRWGWNVVTGLNAPEAELFGGEWIEHDERYRMAAEFVQIVLALWTEEEPIDVDGTYYRVKGRIRAPRPAQRPHPLLVSAGSSPAGVEFASQFCDRLVTLAGDIEALQKVDERVASIGAKHESQLTTTPFAIAIVREQPGAAQAEWDQLTRSINPRATREIASDVLGGIHSARELFAKMGEEEAMMAFGGAGPMLKLIGTPRAVAEQLVAIKRNSAASSILINFPLWSPGELDGFSAVLPYLQEAGIWSPPATRDWSW